MIQIERMSNAYIWDWLIYADTAVCRTIDYNGVIQQIRNRHFREIL